MTGRPIAIADSLRLGYGPTVAVEDVSFVIAPGEYVCLIGRNGSGKTTLIKGMLGLLRPMAGSVTIDGGHDAVAFLPQTQPGAADFPATVREVALSGCQRASRLSPFYTRSDRQLAQRCLDVLGIGDLADRRISLLSGGQRQRAFLARCLCRQPRLLLLDEPFTGLDPEAADSLSRILGELRERRGIAILMSSHDLGAVAANASRVLVLDRRLVFDGKVGEWLSRINCAAPAASLAEGY